MLGSYEDDRFSGFDYQASLGVGYGYKLIAEEGRELSVEIGTGYRVNALEDGGDEKGVTLRLGEKFSCKLSDTSDLEQYLTVEGGDENTISRFGLSVKAQLVSKLSLKVGTSIKYTEEVPDGNDHTDTETSATVVYSF